VKDLCHCNLTIATHFLSKNYPLGGSKTARFSEKPLTLTRLPMHTAHIEGKAEGFLLPGEESSENFFTND
jgi:hypothetical protein